MAFFGPRESSDNSGLNPLKKNIGDRKGKGLFSQLKILNESRVKGKGHYN